MAWRWYRRLRITPWLNANLSPSGVGWSWGVGFIRYGVSPNGRRWISIGIPGTGVRYFKYLSSRSSQQYEGHARAENTVNAMPPEHQSKPITKWNNLK